jgi:hypothetical protein
MHDAHELRRLCNTGRFRSDAPAASAPVDRPDQEYAMKTRIAALVFAIASITPAFASQHVTIRSLSEETGLSERKVLMIVGCRTCVAGYAYTYQPALDKFRKALGKESYERLMSGQSIKLKNGTEVQLRVARIDAR